MAREHGRIFTSIWSDPDWRKLTTRAQHLYLTLLSAPSLSYCGVADWRPKRMLQLADGWTLEGLDAGSAELVDRLYIVVDEGSEEVLVRSFIRNDGLMKQRHMGVSMAKAHSAVASNTLREVIVHELIRLRADMPDLKGWASEMVQKLLTQPSVDPATYPLGHTPIHPVIDPAIDPPIQYESHPPIQPPRQPPSTPSPSPSPSPYSNSGYVSTEGHQRASIGPEPPPRCPKHINEPAVGSCGACGDYRRANAEWHRRDEERAASVKATRRAVIDNCEFCDGQGNRIEPGELWELDLPVVKCDHVKPLSIEDWRTLDRTPAEADHA